VKVRTLKRVFCNRFKVKFLTVINKFKITKKIDKLGKAAEIGTPTFGKLPTDKKRAC